MERGAIWRRYAAAAAGLWVLGACAIAASCHGARAAAVGSGWAVGGIAVALGLASVAWGQQRRLQELLGAIVVGFLVKVLLLGAGLALAIHSGLAGEWFALGFFGAFLPALTIELAAVVKLAGPVGARGSR